VVDEGSFVTEVVDVELVKVLGVVSVVVLRVSVSLRVVAVLVGNEVAVSLMVVIVLPLQKKMLTPTTVVVMLLNVMLPVKLLPMPPREANVNTDRRWKHNGTQAYPNATLQQKYRNTIQRQ
jgi:hypothetical protein